MGAATTKLQKCGVIEKKLSNVTVLEIEQKSARATAALTPIFKRLNLTAYVPNYRKMQLSLIKEKVISSIN